MVLIHYVYYQFVWKRFLSKSPRSYEKYLQEQVDTLKKEDFHKLRGLPKVKHLNDEISQLPIAQFLKSVRLFTYLEPIVTEQIAQAAEEVSIGRGETIENPDNRSFINILKKGKFMVKSAAISKSSVTIVNAGDFLSSLLEVISWISGSKNERLFERNIVAIEDSVIVRIPTAIVKQLSLERPVEAYNCIRIILTRFQRIACSLLFSHFGLTKDLTDIDQVLSAVGTDEQASSLVDELLKTLGVDESEWAKIYQDVEGSIKTIGLTEGSSLDVDGVIYLLSGSASITNKISPNECNMHVGSRSILASTMTIFSSKPIWTLTGNGPITLLHLSHAGLMKIFERHPRSYVGLAKLILSRVSPLSCFVDLCLEWLHVEAGSAICEAGQKADSMYLVVHGRLRSAKEEPTGLKTLAEIGPGSSYGEHVLFQEGYWNGTLFAVRDSELVRVPKDLFDIVIRISPSAGVRMAKIIADRLSSCDHTSFISTPKIATIKTLAIIPNSTSAYGTAESFCKRLYHTINNSEPCAVLTKSAAITALGKHIFTAFGKLKLLEWLNMQEDKNKIVIYFADTPNSPWTHRCIRQVP